MKKSEAPHEGSWVAPIERTTGMETDSRARVAHSEDLFWPNRMGRMYLLALEDVLGQSGVHAILELAGLRVRIGNYPSDNLDLGWTFQETGSVGQAIDEKFGSVGGKGIVSRAGRAWFHHELNDFGAALGIGEWAFRLLPLGSRIELSLNAIADTFNKTSDQVVRVEKNGTRFLYRVDQCPECWNRTASNPICHAQLGLLQESLHRAAGGGGISVQEVSCVAKGDHSCTYVIARHYTV